MIGFLLSPIGRYLLIGLAIVILVGGAILYIYGKGEAAGAAAVIAAAAAEAARRVAAAQKARAEVKDDMQDIQNDPYNRRNRDP